MPHIHLALSLAFGGVVGFSLGLTGGGGSIFAVPLLVYGLSVGARQAIAVSLASVGVTALVGAVQRIRARQTDLRVGLLLAGGGVAGAPLGSWVGGYLEERLLLLLFAVLMVAVAARMWHRAGARPRNMQADAGAGAAARDHPRHPFLLAAIGLVTGILAGLFGVGGGFIIVPALVLFAGMDVHRAASTSLVVIALISAAGVTAQIAHGRHLSTHLTALFIAGGVGGLQLGTLVGRRLSGRRLQRLFAVAILLVAAFVIGRTVFGGAQA